MSLTELQLNDTELEKKKQELYNTAMMQIYSRLRTKRDIIRELGFALEKIGVPQESIAATIATELIHPKVFPEGSKAEIKNARNEREDLSGQINPEAGKSMVHPDYARRNLPEFMKNYSNWQGKEKFDESIKKKKEAGRTTKGKKINYSRRKSVVGGVDYDYEVRKKVQELELSEAEDKKKQASGSVQELPKEESGQPASSTSTSEPSDNTSTQNKRKRSSTKVQPQNQNQNQSETVVEPEDDEIAKVVIDNTLFPSLQQPKVDPAVVQENEQLKAMLSQAQANLSQLTGMYDQLMTAFKEIATPFKERKWVSVTVEGKDYIVGVSYKCDPSKRRIYHKEYLDETRMLLPHDYKTDYASWKKYTGGRMSIDIIVESPQSESTDST